MKKIIISALGVIAATSLSFAGPTAAVSAKDFKQPAVSMQFFKDTEITVDAFYSYNNADSRDPQMVTKRASTNTSGSSSLPSSTPSGSPPPSIPSLPGPSLPSSTESTPAAPSAPAHTPKQEIHPEDFVDGSGCGIGANFFFLRYLGVGLEGNWWKGATDGLTIKEYNSRIDHGKSISTHFGKDYVSQVTANLIIRYPIEFKTFGVAPYILGGGGAAFCDQSCGFADVGAGVEVRLTSHLGVFSDYRWNFMTGGDRNDVSGTRAGIRFVF